MLNSDTEGANNVVAPIESSEKKQLKHWHAPKFMLSEIADTKTQAFGASDGNSGSS